jgi:hypothetical protein
MGNATGAFAITLTQRLMNPVDGSGAGVIHGTDAALRRCVNRLNAMSGDLFGCSLGLRSGGHRKNRYNGRQHD